MLNKITLDDMEIIWPVDWKEKYETIEQVNQTEAGDDQLVITRFNKYSVSVSYKNLNEEWTSTLIAFSKKKSVNVKHYDVETKSYITSKMRMRNFSADKVEYSEVVEDYEGLWNVSFDLEEF